MFPIDAFNFTYPGIQPFIHPVYYVNLAPPPQSQVPPKEPEIQKKKYHRTWKKKQVEEVFTAATRFSQSNGVKIEDMTLEHFSNLGLSFEQSAEQIMMKVNEVNKSQTLRPGIWSESEDQVMVGMIKKGVQKWGGIANLLNNEIHNGLKIRTGKMCKERWNNYLNPEINHGPWKDEEDIVILDQYNMHGNKWSVISKALSNRTESSVKNRIKSLLNKIKQDLTSIEDISFGISRYIQNKRREGSVREMDSASPRSGIEFNGRGFVDLAEIEKKKSEKD